jgi:hypothetical protein
MNVPSESFAGSKKELDLKRFAVFYESLPDGRTLKDDGLPYGAKVNQINKVLGNEEVAKGTIESWVKTAKDGSQKRKIQLLISIFEAIHSAWNIDLTVDQCIANSFKVHENIGDLVEVDRPAVDTIGGEVARVVIRLGKVELLPKSRQVRDEKGKAFPARALLGFSEVTIAVELPDTAESRDAQVKVQFLAASEPATQFGQVNGVTVMWDYGTTEWKMIMSNGSRSLTGQLVNAQLLDFAAEAGEAVKLSIVAHERNFDPVIFLDEASADKTADEKQKALHKKRCTAQILKKRLDGKGRHILASGRMVVK